MAIKISNEVLAVLSGCRTDGNHLFLPPVQLERKMYEAVNKVLVAAGGKWTRSFSAHRFDGDAAEAIDPIMLTGEVTNAKKDLQQFFTPSDVVAKIIEAARIEEGMVLLEPSAGRGAIAAAMMKTKPITLDMVEIDPINLAHMRKAVEDNVEAGLSWTIKAQDFLTVEPEAEYDRVCMNPPFAQQADIKHVQHASHFLRPGGRLVAVMSAAVTFRQDRRAVAFRNVMQDLGADIAELPAESFKTSGTSVNTVLVSFDAPAAS